MPLSCLSKFLILMSARHRYLGSILPTFTEKLLRVQIPKAQKDSEVISHFTLLGPAGAKAVRKHVDETNPCIVIGLELNPIYC